MFQTGSKLAGGEGVKSEEELPALAGDKPVENFDRDHEDRTGDRENMTYMEDSRNLDVLDVLEDAEVPTDADDTDDTDGTEDTEYTEYTEDMEDTEDTEDTDVEYEMMRRGANQKVEVQVDVQVQVEYT